MWKLYLNVRGTLQGYRNVLTEIHIDKLVERTKTDSSFFQMPCAL